MFLSQGATAFHISLLQPQGTGAPAAVLVHAAVSDEQQQVLYGALCDAAQETYEWQALSTCILPWPLDCADMYSAVAGPRHSTVVESNPNHHLDHCRRSLSARRPPPSGPTRSACGATRTPSRPTRGTRRSSS